MIEPRPKAIGDFSQGLEQKIQTVKRYFESLVASLASRVAGHEKRIATMESRPQWTYPCDPGWNGTFGAPLTSTSWDGDSFSTTAKTLIDLSAVFGAPAGIKAALFYVTWRDSGSAAANCSIILSPNNTAGSGLATGAQGQADDEYIFGVLPVPCDANGDVYYEITASGVGTLDLILQIWGYLK